MISILRDFVTPKSGAVGILVIAAAVYFQSLLSKVDAIAMAQEQQKDVLVLICFILKEESRIYKKESSLVESLDCGKHGLRHR